MAIYLISLMGMLCHTAYTGSRVVFPLLAIELGASPFRVGLLIALYAVCPMLLAIYTGKLIDRVGARAPMFVGTLGITLSLLLPAAFPGLMVLYGVALLLGLSSMIFFVAIQGVAGAVGREQDRTRNYGLLSIGFSLAGFLGPLIAGFSIDYLGHQRAMLILASGILVPILLLWLKRGLVPHTTRAVEDKPGQSALDLLRIPALRCTFIAGGLSSGAWDLYSFFMPLYGHHLGLSASAIGTIMAVFAVATIFIRLFLSAMVKPGTEMSVLNRSLYVAGAAFLLFPFFENGWALAAISFLLGLGVGTGQPLSMNLIYTSAPKGRASEAVGVRVTANHCTHVAIPLLFGGVGSAFGLAPVFIVNALILLSAGFANERASQRAGRRLV